MEDEDFIFPAEDVFETGTTGSGEGVGESELSKQENHIAVLNPHWFLEETGHPAHCPPGDLEVSRAIFYFQQGF